MLVNSIGDSWCTKVIVNSATLANVIVRKNVNF